MSRIVSVAVSLSVLGTDQSVKIPQLCGAPPSASYSPLTSTAINPLRLISEIHADKDVENSKWNTPLRETITIHASGNLAADAELPQGK